MTDFAKLLAKRGLTVTILATPLNSACFRPILDWAQKSCLKLDLVSLDFPCQLAGLPEGCENMDKITSPDLIANFFVASEMLGDQIEGLISKAEPRVNCIISSNALPWTAKIAKKLDIPRYIFNALSCFTLLCSHNLSLYKGDEGNEEDKIVVPNMPQRIEFSKAQLAEPPRKNIDKFNTMIDQIKKSESSAQGILVNTFEEMEKCFVDEYRKINRKTWYVGPVSLSNKHTEEKVNRGNMTSIDQHFYLSWLDSKAPGSVIYACFGSLCHIPFPQLVEIGLGLETSNKNFIWIIRRCDNSDEFNKWMKEEEFEERNTGRGLVIRGWAPQVLILSHPSVGGFFTHCGWNSTLEGICAGIPMITWPMFAEQFYNEKLITQVLGVGVRIGVEIGMQWEGKDFKIRVRKEQVQKAIDLLMCEGDEGREIRRRAKELRDVAKGTVEENGSSYLNISMLIDDVKKISIARSRLSKNELPVL